MSDMPTKYEQPAPTAQEQGCGCHKEYVKTPSGILKIVEVVLSLVVLICVGIRAWFVAHYGGGFVEFVVIFGLICSAVLFFLHFTGCINKLPGPWMLIKFATYVALTVLYFIAACVCSAKASADDAIATATFFAWITTIVYGVDTFFKFRMWRESTAAQSHPPAYDSREPNY